MTVGRLVGVDVCQVGAEGDGLELVAHLHALAATYATYLTFLGGQSTLVLVVAEHHNLAVLAYTL